VKRSLLCLVGALAFAWCFELFLAVAMVYVPAHGVRAPLVLGTTSWSFLGGGTREPHAGELFLGNVVITGIFLWLVTVWWAWRGLLVGSLGVVPGLSLAPWRRTRYASGGFTVPTTGTWQRYGASRGALCWCPVDDPADAAHPQLEGSPLLPTD